MMMLEEFKKNFKFFIMMAIVLIFLMSAGVSLFNFSFEINKRVYENLDKNFEFGYEASIDGFFDPAVQKLAGVDYYNYGSTFKNFILPDGGISEDDEIPDDVITGISTTVYSFQDHLPKNFTRALADFNGFVLAGSLWTSADNNKADGKYPIFLSDTVIENSKLINLDLNVGSVFSLTQIYYIEDGEDFVPANGAVLEFVVKGIYCYEDLPGEYGIPLAVIPLHAQLEYRTFMGESIDYTYPVINSLNDFKKFSADAKKQGISYTAYIEEDIMLIGLFSSIFAAVSIAILILCALISFVYCGMFINRRLNFIGLIKALGMEDFKIAKQFFVLLLIIFMFAFIIGNIFSFFLTSHFANLALTLFDYTLNTGFNPLSQLIFGLLTVLTAFISAVLLYRRIKIISVSTVLSQKE